jgi:hypothetical protein
MAQQMSNAGALIPAYGVRLREREAAEYYKKISKNIDKQMASRLLLSH